MNANKIQSKFGCFSNAVLKERPSRWRKASKCKQYVTSLTYSIKIHRRRKEIMIKQSQSDIALLIPDGHFSQARHKARELYEDERRLLAYDKVEHLCTSMLENFPSDRVSDVNLLPKETKEAMAGLIFAASRIGELNELQHIRNLFIQRFGREFDKDNIDLRPGNLVSSETIKILDTKISHKEISPETLIEISKKYQNNIATSVESSEASASSNKVTKKGSKLLHPNV